MRFVEQRSTHPQISKDAAFCLHILFASTIIDCHSTMGKISMSQAETYFYINFTFLSSAFLACVSKKLKVKRVQSCEHSKCICHKQKREADLSPSPFSYREHSYSSTKHCTKKVCTILTFIIGGHQ